MPASGIKIVVKIDDAFFLGPGSFRSILASATLADKAVRDQVKILFPDVDEGKSKNVFHDIHKFLEANNLIMESLYRGIDNSLATGLMTDAFNAEKYIGENLLNFFVVDIDSSEADRFLKQISELSGVSYTYLKGNLSGAGTMANSLKSATATRKIRNLLKKYNVKKAGDDSASVLIVDVEQGWDEKLMSLPMPAMICSGENAYQKEHGANTLNILKGKALNSALLQGLAENAEIRVASVWKPGEKVPRESHEESLIEIFMNDSTKNGGIVLLELQTYISDRGGYLPIEAEPALLQIITCAVAKGIIVIEAAGNGGINLENLFEATFRSVTGKPGAHLDIDVMKKHSAIMVGAINAEADSNYGERIDCYCYGETVNTFYSKDTGYLQFNATSLASAIVASFAAKLQMAAKNREQTLTPLKMKALLKSERDAPPNVAAFNEFIISTT